MKVIGLSGKKQVGKSSVCGFIKQLCPDKKVVEVALAESLKDLVIAGFGIPHESCYGTEEEKNFPLFKWGLIGKELRDKYGKSPDDVLSGREILQIVGTDLFREKFAADLWVQLAFHKIEKLNADIVIISDVRFPNELQAVQNRGGIVVRIERNIDLSHSIQHISETALDNIPVHKFDHFIDKHRNRTMDDLKEATRKILAEEGLL